jgi:hypothetical protein|tara:strand:- start:196 stop:537 length:342 start_codon:yes stop_codon:yes gene_type:complete
MAILMEDAEQKSYENEVDNSSENNHGGKREGAGRRIGSKSKKPWKGMQELAKKHNTSPLDYMLGVLNNPMSSPDKKLYAAEKAAPYIHPRLASSTSRIGSDEPIEIKVEWQKD